MAKVTIHRWSGELGNNLEQIANAYWLAKSTNGQFFCKAKHHILRVPKSIQFGDDLSGQPCGTSNLSFYNKGVDAKNKRFKQYHEILQHLAPTLFKMIKKKKPFNGLVVHVRAGNIYRSPTCGPYMVQAPVKYFSKAMRALEIKKDVLVLTNTRHKKDVKRYPNPIVKEIERYCKNAGLACHVQDDLLDDAIGYLLSAKHAMLTGGTTFSRMLLLANPDLKSVIIPATIPWPHDEISFKHHGCNVHYFDVIDYLQKWSCRHINKQISHPARKIIYRK
jgi:hypothetical protein